MGWRDRPSWRPANLWRDELRDRRRAELARRDEALERSGRALRRAVYVVWALAVLAAIVIAVRACSA